MKQLLIRIDDDVDKELRRVIKTRFGSRKGSLSQFVEQALRDYIRPRTEITNATLIEAIDLIADMISQGKSKADILANLEILFDPEFEASITRGIREKGIAVPPTTKPSQFLRKMLKRKE
ncbi:MAG: hypothetical protein HY619_04185 [Thaumarchaeota archaeon]|nr:hypothetical protein [Nitrososphaerota archaeon]